MAWNQPLLRLKVCFASLETKAVPDEGRATLQHRWGTWEEVCISAPHGTLWVNTQYQGLPQNALGRAGVKILWTETVLRLKNVFKRKTSLSKTVQKWMEFRNVTERKQPRQLFVFNEVSVVKSLLCMTKVTYYFKIILKLQSTNILLREALE